MGVPLYEQQHQVAATTSACDGFRPITKLGNDESLVRVLHLDSTALMGNWPADSCCFSNSAPEEDIMKRRVSELNICQPSLVCALFGTTCNED